MPRRKVSRIEPCRFGHVGERSARDNRCLACRRVANLHRRASGVVKEEDRRYQAERRICCREKVLKEQRDSQNRRYANDASFRERAKRLSREAKREKRLDRSYLASEQEYRAEWRKRNRARCTADYKMYQARKIRQSPQWLSDKLKREILALYELAHRLSDETGVPHHVDHIVPLRGSTAWGLHVPWNLQVITAQENLRKGAIIAQG